MVQRGTELDRTAQFNLTGLFPSDNRTSYRVQPLGDGLFSSGAMTLYDGRHNKYFRESPFSQFLLARRFEDGLLGEGKGDLQGIPQSVLNEYGLNPRNATIVEDQSFSTGDHSSAGVRRLRVARGGEIRDLVLKWNGQRLSHEIASYIQEIQSGNLTRELVMPFIAHAGNGRELPAHLIYEYVDKPDITSFLSGPDAPTTRAAAIALYLKHMRPHVVTWKHKAVEGPIDYMTTALGLDIFDMQFQEKDDYQNRMHDLVVGISQIRSIRDRRHRDDIDENTFINALADYPIALVYNDGKQRILPSANEAKLRTSEIIGHMRTQRMLFVSGAEGDIAGKNSYVAIAYNGLQPEPEPMVTLDKDYYAGNRQFVSLPTMLTTAGRAIGGDQINILSSGFARFNLGLGALEVKPPSYKVPQASLWWQEYAFSETNIKRIAQELNFPADLLMAQVAGSLCVNYTHVAEKYRDGIATNDTAASKMIFAYQMADNAYKKYQHYMRKYEASQHSDAPFIGRRHISEPSVPILA